MKPILRTSLALAAFALIVGAAQSQAQAVIAQYNFTGNSTASSDTNISSNATNLTVGSGLGTLGDVTNGYGFSGTAIGGGTAPNLFISNNAITGNATTPGTIGDAISGSDFVEFTVSLVNPSTDQFDFTTFTTKYAWTFPLAPTGNSTSMNGTLALRSSLDGFTTNLGSVFTAANTQATLTTYSTFTVDLSSLAATNSNVTFRIYMFDAWSFAAAGVGARLDDITLNAAIIPEPSTWALVGLGLSAVLFLRRRRMTV